MCSPGGGRSLLRFAEIFLLLQVAHPFLVAVMSFVIPGQKRDASARGVMRLTPWWAAWRALRHVGRREVGIMILLVRHITPSECLHEWEVIPDAFGFSLHPQ